MSGALYSRQDDGRIVQVEQRRQLDPWFGLAPQSHGDLALRAVALHHARLEGNDVEHELSKLVDAWEATR